MKYFIIIASAALLLASNLNAQDAINGASINIQTLRMNMQKLDRERGWAGAAKIRAEQAVNRAESEYNSAMRQVRQAEQELAQNLRYSNGQYALTATDRVLLVQGTGRLQRRVESLRRTTDRSADAYRQTRNAYEKAEARVQSAEAGYERAAVAYNNRDRVFQRTGCVRSGNGLCIPR